MADVLDSEHQRMVQELGLLITQGWSKVSPEEIGTILKYISEDELKILIQEVCEQLDSYEVCPPLNGVQLQDAISLDRLDPQIAESLGKYKVGHVAAARVFKDRLVDESKKDLTLTVIRRAHVGRDNRINQLRTSHEEPVRKVIIDVVKRRKLEGDSATALPALESDARVPGSDSQRMSQSEALSGVERSLESLSTSLDGLARALGWTMVGRFNEEFFGPMHDQHSWNDERLTEYALLRVASLSWTVSDAIHRKIVGLTGDPQQVRGLGNLLRTTLVSGVVRDDPVLLAGIYASAFDESMRLHHHDPPPSLELCIEFRNHLGSSPRGSKILDRFETTVAQCRSNCKLTRNNRSCPVHIARNNAMRISRLAKLLRHDGKYAGHVLHGCHSIAVFPQPKYRRMPRPSTGLRRRGK